MERSLTMKKALEQNATKLSYFIVANKGCIIYSMWHKWYSKSESYSI